MNLDERDTSEVLGHVKGKTLRLPLTVADAVWAGRMCVGEEGENASTEAYRAVLSCLLRRYVVVKESQNTGWDSFTDLLRAFSQPINPRWENDGTPAQIARRRVMRSLEWRRLPAKVRSIVLALMTGRLPLTAPTAINFADGPTSARFMANNPTAQVVPSAAKNVLLSMPASRGYGREVVVVGVRRCPFLVALFGES